MGVTWITEVASFAIGGSAYYWIATDILNILMGVFIFIIFVCKPNVWNLLKLKFPPIKVLDQCWPSRLTSREESQQTTSTWVHTCHNNIASLTFAFQYLITIFLVYLTLFKFLVHPTNLDTCLQTNAIQGANNFEVISHCRTYYCNYWRKIDERTTDKRGHGHKFLFDLIWVYASYR